MKFLTVVLVVAFAAVALGAPLTDEQKEKLKQINADCQTESHVDHELVSKVRTGVITDDANLKEYLFCFNQKVGTQNSEGKWNVEKLQQHLASRASAEAVQGCAVEKSTPQESAYEAARCLQQHISTATAAN